MLSSPSSFILGTEEWSHIHSCFRWAFPACHWHLLPVNAAVSALHCVLCRAELPSLKARLPGQQRRMPVWIKAPGSAISKGGGGAASWSSWADIFEVKWRRDQTRTKNVPGKCSTALWVSKDTSLNQYFTYLFWFFIDNFGGCCMLGTLSFDI